jgi:hypothetical protein
MRRMPSSLRTIGGHHHSRGKFLRFCTWHQRFRVGSNSPIPGRAEEVRNRRTVVSPRIYGGPKPLALTFRPDAQWFQDQSVRA